MADGPHGQDLPVPALLLRVVRSSAGRLQSERWRASLDIGASVNAARGLLYISSSFRREEIYRSSMQRIVGKDRETGPGQNLTDMLTQLQSAQASAFRGLALRLVFRRRTRAIPCGGSAVSLYTVSEVTSVDVSFSSTAI